MVQKGHCTSVKAVGGPWWVGGIGRRKASVDMGEVGTIETVNLHR